MSEKKLSNEGIHGEDSQRFQRIIKHEVQESKSETLEVLRRWGGIAFVVGAAVWAAAGFLAGKASASDVDQIRNIIETNGNRITAIETKLAAIDRIEAQLYQLAIRTGAYVVHRPVEQPLSLPPPTSPPLR